MLVVLGIIVALFGIAGIGAAAVGRALRSHREAKEVQLMIDEARALRQDLEQSMRDLAEAERTLRNEVESAEHVRLPTVNAKPTATLLTRDDGLPLMTHWLAAAANEDDSIDTGSTDEQSLLAVHDWVLHTEFSTIRDVDFVSWSNAAHFLEERPIDASMLHTKHNWTGMMLDGWIRDTPRGTAGRRGVQIARTWDDIASHDHPEFESPSQRTAVRRERRRAGLSA